MQREYMRSFRDLKVWQKASDLAIAIYDATRTFPLEERFGLAGQMRRAAVSVSSNIAEGFKRVHRKEKYQFYTIALGSLAELESQMEISCRLGFMDKPSRDSVFAMIAEITKMLHGLARPLRPISLPLTPKSSCPNPKSSPLNPSHGFTLVELLVAIAIFTIVVAIATGGFVTALRTQRQAAALIAAQSNASLALEQMAREMRTGYVFCTDPAGGGDPSTGAPDTACFPGCSKVGNVWTCSGYIDFYNGQSAKIGYSLANGALTRSDANGPQPITGDNVVVKYLTFTIFGNTEGDHWNPRITISMGVAPNSNDPALVNNVLDLQTSISSRNIDCLPAGGSGSC